MAYERFVTSRADARRSQRDADLNEEKHCDARVHAGVQGAIDAVSRHWRKDGPDT